MGYNIDEEYNRIVDESEKNNVDYIISGLSEDGKKDPELISRLIRKFGYSAYDDADESIREDKRICDALISVKDEIIKDFRDGTIDLIDLDYYPAAISKNKDIIAKIFQFPLDSELYRIGDELLEDIDFLEYLLNNGVVSALKYLPDKSSDKEFAKKYLLKYPYAYYYFDDNIKYDHNIIKIVITHPEIIERPGSFEYLFEDIEWYNIEDYRDFDNYEQQCAIVLGLKKVNDRNSTNGQFIIQANLNQILLTQIGLLNKKVESLENMVQELQRQSFQEDFTRNK